MKRKRSLGLFSGLALGLGSLYVLTTYFDLTAEQLKGFALSTVTLLVAIFIFAALLVGVIKLLGAVLRRLRGTNHDAADNDHE